MGNPFKTKVDDFVTWCGLAFTHYKNGYYSDSLTNMRKSGEAACKLMIIYKYPEKTAKYKIANKSYKELIEVAKRENLAPRRVINWLESMQIHGNIGTHDNRVMKEQVSYSIEALRLLIIWMFKENLKTSLPKSLLKAIAEMPGNSNDFISEKNPEGELNNLKKEKEESDKQIHEIKNKEAQESSNYNTLNSELEKAAQRIKYLEDAQKKLNFLEKELTQSKQEADELKLLQSEINLRKNIKNKFRNKLLLLITVPLLVLILIWVLFANSGIRAIFNNETGKGSPSFTMQTNDSLRILVLPFYLLQDNPNITIKFEETFVNRLQQNIQSQNLQLSVLYNNTNYKSAVSFDDAIKAGIKGKSDIVIFGEIFEPSGNDSTQVNIKYTHTPGNKSSRGETGAKSFFKLTDSSAIKIMQEMECYIKFALAENYMYRKKFSEALALLYKTIAVTKAQKDSLCEFLIKCHNNQKNYLAELKEIENYINCSPDNSYAYELMADFLVKFGQYIEAEKYYNKALAIKPDKVSALLNYADLLSGNEINKQQLSKELIKEAIRNDSTSAVSWQYLADWEYRMKNFDEAKKIYLKCIKIAPGIIRPKLQLAEILAYYSNDPKTAENYLFEVLKNDNSNIAAINLLANIYTSTSLKNPVKAEFLFKLSKKLKPAADTTTINYNLGIAAYNKKNYRSAISYFLKSFSSDNSDISQCNYIGQAYLNMKEYDNALLFLKRASVIDSLNFVVNYNLGYFYANIEKHVNFEKAAFYFERALITNPDDANTTEYLGKIYFYQNKLPKAKKICSALYKINPENAFANKSLGVFAYKDKDYAKALKYYRKSLDAAPDDDEVCAGIAIILIQISPSGNIQEALKFAKRAILLNPQSADNLYAYSKILVCSGDYARSAEFYYKALNSKPSLKDVEMEKTLKEKGF